MTKIISAVVVTTLLIGSLALRQEADQSADRGAVEKRMSVDPIGFPSSGDFIEAVRIAGGSDLSSAELAEGALLLKGTARAVETAARFAEQFSLHAVDPAGRPQQINLETRFIKLPRSAIAQLPDALRLRLATTHLVGKTTLVHDAKSLLTAHPDIQSMMAPNLTLFDGQNAQVSIGTGDVPKAAEFKNVGSGMLGDSQDGEFEGMLLRATASTSNGLVAVHIEGRLNNLGGDDDVPAHEYTFNRTFITPTITPDSSASAIPIVAVLHADAKGNIANDRFLVVVVRATVIDTAPVLDAADD